MDFEQQLRMAFAPCEPRPELWASVLKQASAAGASARGKPRSGSQTILFSTILAVAAAAAMMAWLLARKPEPHPTAVAVVPLPAIEPTIDAVAEPRIAETAPRERKATKPPVPAAVLPPVAPFSVRLLPLRNDARDPGAKEAVDAFYSAFVEDLQSVPGLKLIRALGDSSDEDPLPDFQLAARGAGDDASGKFTVGISGDSRIFLEMKRKLIRAGKEVGEGSAFASSTQGDINASCAPVGGDGTPGCRTPATAAAGLVDGLRKRTFPQDPSLKLRFQQDLLDGSLDPARRLKALLDLGSLKSPVPGEILQEPSVVTGAIALANSSTDPAIRAQVWRAMRGSRNPDLETVVIESLRHDRDAEVPAGRDPAAGGFFQRSTCPPGAGGNPS